MNIQTSPNFLSDLVSRLDAVKDETASQEKQSGWWNDAKMMASYGASNPWQMTKATGSGLHSGLGNMERGVKGLAETVAGGIGTGLTGLAAGREFWTDMMGRTDPSFNTSWQAAKNMGEFTAGGAKNVGSAFGLRGHNALMGRGPNPVTQTHERLMNEAGYSDSGKNLARTGLGVGRFAAGMLPWMFTGGIKPVVSALRKGQGIGAAGRAGFKKWQTPASWASKGPIRGIFGGKSFVSPAKQYIAPAAATALGAGVMASDPLGKSRGQVGPSVPPMASKPSGAGSMKQVPVDEDENWGQPQSAAPAAPAAPADNYKGFEIDGWRPRGGKDTFKMSADINFNNIKNLAILASRRHYIREKRSGH